VDSAINTEAPVVVDGGNVAGSEDISGCGKFCWDRIAIIRRLWQTQIDSQPQMTIVIDESVTHRFGAHCRAKYQQAARESGVLVQKYADSEILKLAEQTDAVVLTRDLFRDHRRAYPWIDGNTTRFVGWRAQDGQLVLEARDMGTPTDYTKSEYEENSELKASGANLDREEVRQALSRAYRCDTTECWVHKFDQGRFTGVPDLKDPSAPRCPVCKQCLVELGPIPKLVQVKFSDVKRNIVERLTLSPDMVLDVGRESSKDMLMRVVGQLCDLVSRTHLRIMWDGSTLKFTDYGSKNGTTFRRWLGKRRGYSEPIAVTGTSFIVGPRDEVTVAGVLVVTRSAREFTLDSASSPTTPKSSGDETLPNS